MSVLLRIVFCWMLIIAGTVGQARAAEVSQGSMERIQSSGRLTAGVSFDIPGMGYKDPKTGAIEGLSQTSPEQLRKSCPAQNW